MPDRGTRSLLAFAAAATLAVVPILAGVLLAIGELLPSDRTSAVSDRHVSVRQLAALKTFEWAIVPRERASGARFDKARLADAIPECAREWTGKARALDRVKSLVRGEKSQASVAARIASDLVALDDALGRMSAAGPPQGAHGASSGGSDAAYAASVGGTPMSGSADRRVAVAVGFDLSRWSDAARRALAQPVESAQYPGRAFRVTCADLAAAVTTLSRSRGRMLDALAWRGTEVQRRVASWRDDQYVEISMQPLARANPWAGVPGCVYLGRAESEEALPSHFVALARGNERLCAQPDVFATTVDETLDGAPSAVAGEPRPDTPVSDARWLVPPSLAALLQPLETLTRPSGRLYRAYHAQDAARRSQANRAALDGVEVDVGYSVDLTIDPALQATAQKVAACYTGRQDVCAALGVHRAEDANGAIGQRLLERAVVRMAAIAIVDVDSGRIEALAGALSPCTRSEYDGPGRAHGCDARLPYPVRYRPDALLNPAVFHDAMPASLVKPVMAAAFLADAAAGARWLAAERAGMARGLPDAESLRGQLMRSNSARFLDRMFCRDRSFAACERVWAVEAMASAFGWNGGCASASERCGRRDLLFGRSVASGADEPLAPVASWVPYGRLMVEPQGRASAGTFALRRATSLDASRVRRCALGRDGRHGSADDWEKCSGGAVVDVVAEGWGQGHARSTALGAAGMMAALAAAANGETSVRKPHLVHAIRGVAGETSGGVESDASRWAAASIERNGIAREAAEVILSGLSYSHRNGTARLACEQVFDPRRCGAIDWIAGKTGTPTFPNDDRTLGELARLCAPGVQRNAADNLACGGLRPYKWYVAAYRTDASGRWTKAIGVLTERNWIAATGRIHGAGDHGPNPAAEIALQVAARHVGELASEAR